MSEEEINQAIAEACGWTFGPLRPPANYKPFYGGENWFLPKFCHDLNAMHEAERILVGPINITLYMRHLRNILDVSENDAECMQAKLVHATARQRAEAFLRALGKWREE